LFSSLSPGIPHQPGDHQNFVDIRQQKKSFQGDQPESKVSHPRKLIGRFLVKEKGNNIVFCLLGIVVQLLTLP